MLEFLIIRKQGGALLLCDLLEDHALRLLRGDAAEVHHLELDLRHVAQAQRRVELPRLVQADLQRRILYLFDDVLHRANVKIAGLAVDADLDIIALSVLLFAGAQKRILDRLQQDLTVNILFLLEDIQSFHQFGIHGFFLLK